MNEDFLLENSDSQRLFHEYAENMPILDYHCHLPPEYIAKDHQFENLTQAWLEGDHYKWRAMRTCGVDENFVTGKGADVDKFSKWSEVTPQTLRNPLYHWTHLELRRMFNEDRLLSPKTSESIYQTCSEKLQTPEFSVKNILRKMNVKALCTTDDPISNLSEHRQCKKDGFEVKVLPTFRPDKSMAIENPKEYRDYIELLSASSNIDISSYSDLLTALKSRHDFFHAEGCRLSDHGLKNIVAEKSTPHELVQIFDKVMKGESPSVTQINQFQFALMLEFGKMNANKGWVQQLHLGALRNNNTRMFKKIGADMGYDSIGDFDQAHGLSRLLDELNTTDELSKTIIYNLNPRDNELFAAMIGNFQDGKTAGKIQFGSGWWFLDQKEGMERQMNALSRLGLLSKFVGMLTDSRSFLSFPRHEYFRRILCNLIGKDMENGEIPRDWDLVGGMVKDICYNNANRYFSL